MYKQITIVTIVLGHTACAMVCERVDRVARVVQIIGVSTRVLPVYIKIVFRRQRQLVKVAVASWFVARDRRVCVQVVIVVRIRPDEKAGQIIKVAVAVRHT